MLATGLFTLLSVPLLVVVPLFVAMLLNKRFPGRTFFRAVVFAPYVLGVVVVGLLFRFILDPSVGVLNYLLGRLGFAADTPWTTAEPWVWVSLVLMTLWWTLGFNAFIYLAGLQEINRELYDAAAMDGAKRRHRFRHVTLPGLRPVFVFVVTVTILASRQRLRAGRTSRRRERPPRKTRTAIMFIAGEGFPGLPSSARPRR